MAVSITHAFVSPIPDLNEARQGVVRPSHWNDEHAVTGLGTAAERDDAYFEKVTGHQLASWGLPSTATTLQSAIDAASSSEGALWGRRPISANPATLVSLDTEILIDTDTVRIDGLTAKWIGAAGENLLTIRNSSRSRLIDCILLGNKDAIPQALLYLRADALASSNNENTIVDGVIFNRRAIIDTTTGGAADATPNFKSQYCVLIGGAYSGNNDEFLFRNCQFHNATVAAAYIENTQSIWGVWDNCLFNDAPKGLYTGANTTLRHCTFNRCTTADIDAFRDVDVWVDGVQAENSIIFARSAQGASFYIRDGKLLRNNAVASTFFDVQNGGSLILENLVITNVGGTGDTIKWRGGTSGGTRQIIRVRGCEIAGGNIRSTWDIHSGALGGVIVPEIDIEAGAFKWKTRMPYIDIEVDAGSASNDASVLVSTDSAGTLGRFYNVSAGVDLQEMHATAAHDSASVMRARVLNLTGSTVDLASTRWRWMDLSEHVKLKASKTIDVGLTANGAGSTETITVYGAKLGDFAAWSCNSSFTNQCVSAYVSAADTVTLRFHNATGGNSDPASATHNAAILREFGNFMGSASYAGSTISTGSQITIDVTVTGAQIGGHAFFAYSSDLTGLFVSCHVSAADTVTVVLSNESGGDVIVAAGLMRAMVAF